MAVYAIGDIQGCHKDLLALLSTLKFDASSDYLWFTGDIVNRGTDSLSVLRFVRTLGDHAITVLGNHDLHLLAIATGVEKPRRLDTLDDILAAPDRDELLLWLRNRPLLHYDPDLNFVLTHAGIPPQWDLDTAQACAREMESMLRGENYREFFQHMYGDEPSLWSSQLHGWDRYRYITNAFTRMRFCTTEGALVLHHKGSPGSQPEHLIPWFEVQNRPATPHRLVFGHWSTLGDPNFPNIFPLDNGCVWGGMLTALSLDAPSPVFTHLPCQGDAEPD